MASDPRSPMMTSGPLKFEIIDRLGHGQFSTVYKAKWIDPPKESDSCMPHYYQGSNGAKITINNHHHLAGPLQNGSSMRNQQVPPTVDISSDSTANGKQAARREKLVALKRIELCDIQNSQARMDYLKEVNLLQQVKHPNIINFNISFIERNELFIVLELADGGDLSKLIKYFQRKKRLIPEQTILKYFTQVSSAVDYIHSKRILHRDIKPANIFMTSEGCVKLGDFGLGRFFSQNTRDAHSIVGTFYYMSPERIRESGYGFSSDVWSLGCVLYELITLNSPFSIFNQQDQQVLTYDDKRPLAMQQIAAPQTPPQLAQNNQYNLQWLMDRITRAEYPSLDGYGHISLTLRQLAGQCLNPNPEARPNMQYICAIVYDAFRLVSERSPISRRPTQSQQIQHQTPLQANPTHCLQQQVSMQTNSSHSNHHHQHPIQPNQNHYQPQFGIYDGY